MQKTLICCVLLMICIWTSPQWSQMSCERYSKDLPSSLDCHVAGYSASANSMYIMDGYDGSAVYKWDLNPDASYDWFKPIGSIPDLDSKWCSHGVQTMFAVDNIYFGVDEATHTVNRFDTVSDQWLANGAEPLRKVTGGCVAHNGSHFVMIDGWANSGVKQLQFVFIQFYDIARDAWSLHTVKAPFGIPVEEPYIQWRYQYCAFVEDKLYMFGGKVGDSTFLNEMWRYDTLSQQFIRIGTLPRTCAYGTTALDGFGHMYLVGCFSKVWQYTNEIQVFDASTESLVSDIMEGRELISDSAAVVFNRTLWIFGGWTSTDTASAKVQICDISHFVPTEQPSATSIHMHQPVVQMQPQPQQLPQFVAIAHAAVRQPILRPNPLNAGAEEKFVYDPNRNYKKEGAAASIITPHVAVDQKSDGEDNDEQINTQHLAGNNNGAHVYDTNAGRSDNTLLM